MGIGEAPEIWVNNEVEADQLEKGRSSGFLAATDLTAVDGQGILEHTLGTGINLGIPLTSIYSRGNVVPQAEKLPYSYFFFFPHLN